MNDSETLITFGDTVKHLGGNRIGGYLLRWGSPEDRDLEGDYFTPDTYLGESDRWTVVYHHGLDDTLKTRPIGTAHLVKKDDVGVWIEAQLNARDEYERAILELAQSGKLGWSSGAVGHLVDYDNDGHIRQWVIGEASLTPIPAEPRNAVMPLKSLTEKQGVTVMTEVQTQAEAPQAEALVIDAAALKGVIEEALEEAFERNQKALKRGDNPVLDDNAISALVDARVKAYLNDVLPGVVKSVVDARKAVNVAPVNPDGGGKERVKRWKDAVKSYLRDNDPSALKALSEGTGSAGGYTVDSVLWSDVVQPLKEASYLRQAGARVITLAGTNSVSFPRITNTGAATIVSENSSYPSADPSFAQVQMTPYKLGSIRLVSEELLADSAYDIENLLRDDLVYAFAQGENTYFTTGTGSGQPTGIVTAASVGKTTTSNSAITYDELIDFWHSLNHLYRQNAVWMMNDSTAAALRKLKTSDGMPLWNDLANGGAGTLMGRPVITNNSMATIGSQAKVAVLFNPVFYYIVQFENGLPRLLRLSERYADVGQVGFRGDMRIDANLVNPSAASVLQMAV